MRDETLGRAENTFRRASRAFDTGHLAEAELLWREALALYETTDGTINDQARSLLNLAGAIANQGRLVEAEALYRQALDLFRQTEVGTAQTARSQANLANLLTQQGRLSEGEGLYRQALALYETTEGTAADQARVRANLANSIQQQGRLSEAEALYRDALALFELEEITDEELAEATFGLAESLSTALRLTEAEDASRHSINLFTRALGSHPRVAAALLQLALILTAQGKYTTTNEVERLYREALRILREWRSSPEKQADCILEIATILRTRDELTTAAAASMYTECLDLYRDSRENLVSQVTCLVLLSSLAENQGPCDTGSSYLERAVSLLESVERDMVVLHSDLVTITSHLGLRGHEAVATRFATQAAIIAEEHRFDFAYEDERTAWIRNTVDPTLEFALSRLANQEAAETVADLVAMWRMAGTSTTGVTQAEPRPSRERPLGPNDIVDLAGPHVIQPPAHPETLKSLERPRGRIFPRDPGPVLILPYACREALADFKVQRNGRVARYI